jgi:hypothetical protein
MADIQGTYDVETNEVLTWYITGEHEDCKGGTGSPAGGKEGGPGGDGSQAADDETMGRGTKCDLDGFKHLALTAALDVTLGGATEIVHGLSAIAHANGLLRAGRTLLSHADDLLREGNAASAAVMEGNGLRMLFEGGALGGERLTGEALVGRGVAGSIQSFATARNIVETIASFAPYGATIVGTIDMAEACIRKYWK